MNWLTICTKEHYSWGNGSVRYAIEFSAEVYEIMIVYVMKIYDMNMKFYMQECLKVSALKCIWTLYDDIIIILFMKVCIFAS